MTTPQSEQEWRDKLTAEQYEVMREKGTELPYTGEYITNKKRGAYHCAGCGELLFSSKTKFDFGSGWPCFSAPESEEGIGTEKDMSLTVERTAVFCNACKSHLGHVFDDGPELRGGKRYCINSCVLAFVGDKEEEKHEEERKRNKHNSRHRK